MAYFNHAFKKSFLATGPTQTAFPVTLPDGTTVSTTTSDGYVTTAGVPTYGLNQLSAISVATYGAATTATTDGYIGWFDPKSNVSLILGTGTPCCTAYLAGSAIYSSDKIGPLTGGYQETNKSKMVNPKYVSRFYEVEPCAPQNNVIHVGSTYWTAGGGVLNFTTLVGGTGYGASLTGVISTAVGATGTGLVLSYDTNALGVITSVTIIAPGKDYTNNDTLIITGGNNDASIDQITITSSHAQEGCGISPECCKEYLCGETYSLRLDVKGSPALRFLNHNAYSTQDAYTGCCPAGAIAPVAVDSTEVMILWANGLTNDPIVGPFVQIVVQAEDGTLLYAPGTSAAWLAAEGAITWNNYVSPGHVVGACAGLILNGAYVDTKFGDCTFQLSDFYEKEPVKLYASEVDYNGDPCAFTTLCVVTECQGLQVQGLGETVVRDMTMSESYRQNFLASDFRIREITQGNQIISSVDRSALYFRYMLQHNVPRNYNPSGTFDADQYMLEVFSLGKLATFYSDTYDWLDKCGVCDLEQYACSTICVVPVAFPTVPVYNPYNVVSCN
tara:strand:+ start:1855 stop:3528 length:1674 start_codon:yes stop_codon:yes gene_type:complete